jgi:CRP-like cAMP-binding protein
MSWLVEALDDDDRRRAERVLARCPTVGVPAGGSAEVPDVALLLVVEDGIVLVAGGDGRRIVVALAGPGEVLAPPSGARELRGLTRGSVTALTRDAERALMAIPGAAAAVTDSLLDAIGDREQSVTNLGRYPHSERVRGKFLQLAGAHGRVVEGGVLVDLPLTHDLIAESIGSTRETVTLALRELMRSGFVSRVDRRYRLSISPEELS